MQQNRTDGFLNWRDHASEFCQKLLERQCFLKIILKTKNERHFLDDWISHHAAIVGHQNLIIFDNMSTDEDVLRKYAEYSKDIPLVQYDGFHNFIHVKAAFPRLYDALSKCCQYFIFLDSDEFLTVFDGKHHAAGSAVTDFIGSAGRHEIIPAAWVENLPGSSSLFECGTDLGKLNWGLQWGKPVLRATANLPGILLHNIQVLPSLGKANTPLNLFVLHMKSLYPEQRKRVNIEKLAKRGFCSITDVAEEIIQRDLKDISDQTVIMYVEELRKIIEHPIKSKAFLASGAFELNKDGSIGFYSPREEGLLETYLAESGQLLLDDILEANGVSLPPPGTTPNGLSPQPPASPFPSSLTATIPASQVPKEASEKARPSAPASTATLSGDREAAISQLRAALALNSADLNLYKSLAWELIQASHLDEAFAVCTAALALGSEDPDILLRLGLIARLRGERPMALDKFRAVLTQRPGHLWASLELAAELQHAGQLSEAESLCHSIIEGHPENTQAFIRLGLIARLRGESCTALSHFQAALRIAPDHPWARREWETERERSARYTGSSATSPSTAQRGKKGPESYMTDRVFRSSENVLYLSGGSNAASRLYTTTGFDSSVDVSAWHRLIENRSRILESLNVQFRQLIVPEKLTVLPLPAVDRRILFDDIEDIKPPGERLVQSLPQGPIVYPKDFLIAQAAHYPIYPATDSHWTWSGALSAFQLLMNRYNISIDFLEIIRLPRSILTYHGDIWDESMGDIAPDKFIRLRFPDSLRRVYCNSLVGAKERYSMPNETGLHVGSHCVFHNPSSQRKETVILFGTSFSEYRIEPSLLTSIFAFFFETVHFVWSTSLDFDYIERFKPSLVVAEIPERFLVHCPSDNFEVESFAVERLKSWKAAQASPLKLRDR